MGKELEYKLLVPNEHVLSEILQDTDIAAFIDGQWREIPMKTTYYDGPDRRFSTRHWTLRRRMEGEESIICLKTPLPQAHTCGEWQLRAQALDHAAVDGLLRLGAPEALRVLYGQGDVAPICGAVFLRRAVMLRFPDGSRAELAGDHGILHGRLERKEFTELELELYEGTPEEMTKLLRLLCVRYGLAELKTSKFARASVLK